MEGNTHTHHAFVLSLCIVSGRLVGGLHFRNACRFDRFLHYLVSTLFLCIGLLLIVPGHL